ncbi:MAG: biotin--[acetyl-CoA-carboxylase] ligase [Candidatus Heimdallarchaeota archaeon]|nr:biotin--[acetyl-CoA-carboxylase] ligase [Candidatus Heimdallarchaeota archaeon]
MNDKERTKIIRFSKLDSTQLFARTLINQSDNSNGTIIIAEEQTLGKGRLNRSWISPIGGVWLSIIIQRKIPLKILEGFSIRYGIKLVRALRKLTKAPFQVKWPNDIILNSKKLGGILIDLSSREDSLESLILGIGINVNIQRFPHEIEEIATSMQIELKKEFSLNDIEEVIINSYQELIIELLESNLERISEIWKDFSYTFNSFINIQSGSQQITGKEIGITETGNLKIEKNGKNELISMGEISLIRKVDET